MNTKSKYLRQIRIKIKRVIPIHILGYQILVCIKHHIMLPEMTLI